MKKSVLGSLLTPVGIRYAAGVVVLDSQSTPSDTFADVMMTCLSAGLTVRTVRASEG